MSSTTTHVIRWRSERGRLEARSEPLEPLSPGQVLVCVRGCVIGDSVVRALGTEGACPGDAATGDVVAASEEAKDWLGRRVLASAVLPCGQCDVCLRGRGPACPKAMRLGRSAPGALATHLVAPARALVALEEELAPPEATPLWTLAALAGPAARIYHAICRAGLGPGELALFIGDTAESRIGLALARARAAEAVVIPLERDVDAESLVGDRSARVWRVFETTGEPHGLASALACVKATGSLSLLGQEGPAILPRAPLLEVPVLLTDAPHPDLMVELVALHLRGELALDPIVAPVAPDELARAVRARLEGDGSRCPIFRPQDDGAVTSG